MSRIFGRFSDGFTICYRIPSTHTLEVYGWLRGLGLNMKVWIGEEE